MLRRALLNVGEYHLDRFAPDIALEAERFYREEVEPNRYSRTADFTLQQIRGAPTHKTVENYRVRYHSRPETGRRRSYTGNFDHSLDPEFYGAYCLFTDFSGIANPFAVACASAGEWLLAIAAGAPGRERVHHEMVGPRFLHDGHEILCSLPSRKFSTEQTAKIFADTVASVRNGVYHGALVYATDVLAAQSGELDGLAIAQRTPTSTCFIGPVVVFPSPSVKAFQQPPTERFRRDRGQRPGTRHGLKPVMHRTTNLAYTQRST